MKNLEEYGKKLDNFLNEIEEISQNFKEFYQENKDSEQQLPNRVTKFYSGNKYKYEIELAGYKKENVNILSYKDFSIQIKIYHNNLETIAFNFKLQTDSDINNIKAEMKDGLLTIMVDRIIPLQPKNIPIK